MRAFLGALVSRWFLTLVLTLVLCALIWPYAARISFDDVRPFASDGVRLLIIVILLVIWGLFARADARAKPAAQDDETGKAKAQPAAARDDAVARGPNSEERRTINREIELMRREFGEGMRRLRRAARGLRIGGGWRYQLPWYLMLGAEGTGKSALLAQSGLSFPLGEPGALQPGTEHQSIWAERVGLWLGDDAVFVEPPGDLVDDAQNQTVAGAVWSGLLDVIRRNRPRQPLNGIILTVALPELLQGDEDALREHANRLRNRLREIRRHLGMRLPVYLVLTQADRLAGFGEFFDELPRDQRDQVLGITLQVLDDGSAVTPLAALEPEFDALLDSLNRRVMERLHREPDIARRGLSFAFPQQLALARGPLRVFMDALFTVSRYEERQLARGVYLTSAEQDGAPVDLMRGVIATLVQPAAGARAFGGQAGRRAYFIADLLRKVVLAEAFAAGLDPRHERRRRARTAGVVGLLAVFALGLALAWQLNLSESHRLLDQHNRTVAWANQLTGALMQSADANGIVDQPDFDGVTLPLDELRTTRDELSARVADRSWRSYLGYYRGPEIGAASARAYDAALRGQFLPRILLHLEQRLTDWSLPEDRLYVLLRAYLMLGGEGPMAREDLAQTLALEWADALPGRENLATRTALERHLDALEIPDNSLPELRPDIVAFARERLNTMSRGERGMNVLRAQPAIQRLPTLRLAEIGGPLTQQVLTRRSGASLQDGVPGLFTARGFEREGKPAVDRVALMMAREGWVMGAPIDAASIAAESFDIREEILQVYAEQYIREWEGVLSDIAVVPMTSIEQAASTLSVLGGATSPLRRLYIAAATETNLMAAATAPEDPGADTATAALDAAASLSARAAAAQRRASIGGDLARSFGMVGAADDQLAERLVTDRFASLRDLVGENGEGPELSALISRFGEAAQVFTRLEHGPDPDGAFLALLDGSASSGVPVAAGLANAAATLPAPLNAMMGDLSTEIRAVGARGAQDVIARRWSTDVVPVCTAVTAGRFPVDPAGTDLVTIEDFTGLFGPGGLLDTFFTERLAPLVDTGSEPWRWRDGRGTDIGFAIDTPRFFQRVQAMRIALFPGGAAVPTVRFQLRPRTLDAAADRITVQIGEQRMQYAHGVREAQSFEWIAADDGEIRVFMTPSLPGQPDGLRETGPWSLFTFLRAATLLPTELPDRYDLALQLGNRTASFELQGSSIGNPFTFNLFAGLTCPETL